MDWLTFIASMTGHLAWPLAAVLILYFFRGPILERLPFLSKATYRDFSIEFRDRLDDVAEKVSKLPKVDDQLSLPAPIDADEPQGHHLDSSLDASRSVVILQSWLPVEEQLKKLARTKGYAPDRTRSPTYTIRQLVSDGTIGADDAEVLREMVSLRNLAAHAGSEAEITVEDAQEYRALSEVTLQRIKRLQ